MLRNHTGVKTHAKCQAGPRDFPQPQGSVLTWFRFQLPFNRIAGFGVIANNTHRDLTVTTHPSLFQLRICVRPGFLQNVSEPSPLP